jgi:hypothetical protein
MSGSSRVTAQPAAALVGSTPRNQPVRVPFGAVFRSQTDVSLCFDLCAVSEMQKE